jgi:hypothetical protein
MTTDDTGVDGETGGLIWKRRLASVLSYRNFKSVIHQYWLICVETIVRN